MHDVLAATVYGLSMLFCLLVAIMPRWLDASLKRSLARMQDRMRRTGEHGLYFGGDTDPRQAMRTLRVWAVAALVVCNGLLLFGRGGLLR